MKLVIARLNHETNAFSPVPTPLEAFEPQWGPTYNKICCWNKSKAPITEIPEPGTA